MQKTILIMLSVVLLAACSHKPPKPYGTPFPINAVQEKHK